MNKKEFIDVISNKTNFTKKDSEKAVNAVINCMMDLLSKGDKITLPGFATFEVRKRAARTGRNPSNGKPLHIPATNTVRFSAGTKLKEAINS